MNGLPKTPDYTYEEFKGLLLHLESCEEFQPYESETGSSKFSKKYKSWWLGFLYIKDKDDDFQFQLRTGDPEISNVVGVGFDHAVGALCFLILFHLPLEYVPLYLNTGSQAADEIVKWRLRIRK